MNKMLLSLAIAAAASSAIAADLSQVTKSIPLKDGSTVYIFKDGKMSMEDSKGRIVRMKPGHVMETKDGKKVIMVGDEVMRLEKLLHEEHKSGG